MKLEHFVCCTVVSIFVILSCAQQYHCLSHDSIVGYCTDVKRGVVQPVLSKTVHKPNNKWFKALRKTDVTLRLPEVNFHYINSKFLFSFSFCLRKSNVEYFKLFKYPSNVCQGFSRFFFFFVHIIHCMITNNFCYINSVYLCRYFQYRLESFRSQLHASK